MKLADQRCQPRDGQAAMPDDEVEYYLDELSGWARIDGALEKAYAFATFHEAMAFANAIAWLAEREDHHPDLAISHGRCAVRLATHAVGGLSMNDFICAAKIDALLP
jgi:4a-hydroxytetrahydrobiopterin dehydratase